MPRGTMPYLQRDLLVVYLERGVAAERTAEELQPLCGTDFPVGLFLREKCLVTD